MQKERSDRKARYALEDALNMKGFNSQRAKLFEINTTNRDRPGGHETMSSVLESAHGWPERLQGNGRKSVKRRVNKQLRRESQKITQEAMTEYEWYHASYCHSCQNYEDNCTCLDVYSTMAEDNGYNPDWEDSQLHDDDKFYYYGDDESYDDPYDFYDDSHHDEPTIREELGNILMLYKSGEISLFIAINLIEERI